MSEVKKAPTTEIKELKSESTVTAPTKLYGTTAEEDIEICYNIYKYRNELPYKGAVKARQTFANSGKLVYAGTFSLTPTQLQEVVGWFSTHSKDIHGPHFYKEGPFNNKAHINLNDGSFLYHLYLQDVAGPVDSQRWKEYTLAVDRGRMGL